MAQKTSVDGNRVTIDGEGYIVVPAGTDRYRVSDDFGGALGYFSLQGKSISTDDYGVAGAPPLKLIGRLWRAGQEGNLDDKPPPTSKMVCEVLTLAAIQPADLDKARAHLTWLKTQPGLETAFYAQDVSTGKAMAVRVWKNRTRLEAHRNSTPPDDATELPSSSVEVLALIADL